MIKIIILVVSFILVCGAEPSYLAGSNTMSTISGVKEVNFTNIRHFRHKTSVDKQTQMKENAEKIYPPDLETPVPYQEALSLALRQKYFGQDGLFNFTIPNDGGDNCDGDKNWKKGKRLYFAKLELNLCLIDRHLSRLNKIQKQFSGIMNWQADNPANAFPGHCRFLMKYRRRCRKI